MKTTRRGFLGWLAAAPLAGNAIIQAVPDIAVSGLPEAEVFPALGTAEVFWNSPITTTAITVPWRTVTVNILTEYPLGNEMWDS